MLDNKTFYEKLETLQNKICSRLGKTKQQMIDEDYTGDKLLSILNQEELAEYRELEDNNN